ncbi:MAG: beta-ketoacyl-ACP synthase [Parvibaculum sp.]|nr:beta-ketoacyl-ACP synthase [Parvibaculum sp.]
MSRFSDSPVFLSAMSAANALGAGWDEVATNLFAGDRRGLGSAVVIADGRTVPVGALSFELAALPVALSQWESRNNRLILHCLQPLMSAIESAKEKFGANRVGAVIGTSTSGISCSEAAVAQFATQKQWPDGFTLSRQELGDPAAFVAEITGIAGPYYGISTACTSGAKALASAARLLRAGMCDAVIAGGVDTLCNLTLNGFSVLDSIAPTRCNPFSTNRNGISIGEGGALFLVTRDEAPIRLAGYGESADAHHLSAPDPEGTGAKAAIAEALDLARISARDISYLNLHGTATRLNDAMESAVTHSVFGDDLLCSSTKGMTGHMLGAAGSNEAAFVAMALQRGEAPPHIWDGERDVALSPLNFADRLGERVEGRYMMSCSYAFGGNNTALILARS